MKGNYKIMIYAPIILFVYNRPDHARLVLEQLKKNIEAKESQLFIFSDENENKFFSFSGNGRRPAGFMQ